MEIADLPPETVLAVLEKADRPAMIVTQNPGVQGLNDTLRRELSAEESKFVAEVESLLNQLETPLDGTEQFQSLSVTGDQLGLSVTGELNLVPYPSEENSAFVVAYTPADQPQSDTADDRFEMFFENTAHALIMVDEAGIIEMVNQKTEEIFGYGQSKLVGEPVDMLVPQNQRDQHQQHRHEFMDNPEPRPMGEGRDLYAVHKDGTEIPVEIGLNPIPSDNGHKVVADITDITQRKEAEKQLERFIYQASHDLKEPVRKLIGYCDLLENDIEQEKEEKIEEDMEYILDAAERMDEMISSLLELSRVDQGDPEPAPVDVENAINEALDNLEVALQNRDVEIRKDELNDVMADPVLVRQLYQNLCENALKYNQSEQRVLHFTSEVEPEWVTLGVLDNGIGIDPEYRDQIFEPFKRLESRGDYEGSGMGLAICREIVDRFGGRIWAEESELGGTHIRFQLPVVR